MRNASRFVSRESMLCVRDRYRFYLCTAVLPLGICPAQPCSALVVCGGGSVGQGTCSRVGPSMV